MKAWLGRLVHRAARAGRRPLAVDAGLAARRGLPFRLLDIPPEPSGPAVAYLVEQLRDLAALLQSLTGRPLNEASFEAAVDRSREAVRLARTLYRQRCSLGRNVFHAHQMINLLFPLHSLAGTRRLNDTLRALIRDLGDGRRWCRSYGRPLTDPDAVRLVWAHIAPLYDYNSVWGILDDGQRAKVDSAAAGREQHATRAEAFLESLRGTGGRGVRRG